MGQYGNKCWKTAVVIGHILILTSENCFELLPNLKQNNDTCKTEHPTKGNHGITFHNKYLIFIFAGRISKVLL